MTTVLEPSAKVVSHSRAQLVAKGAPFTFSDENLAKLQTIMAKYPDGRQASAVLPALDLAQRQNGGWVSKEAIETVANHLQMPVIRVWEVASFYTMFNLEPVGEHFIQVCRTTPCWLRGSDEVVKACQDVAGVNLGETSADGKFTVVEVECLGACVNAPMVQINDDYYEDLTYTSMTQILTHLKDGKPAKPGPQVDRLHSAPVGGMTTLKGAKA
jgi:NADH-quinone oxidoreductase subunit E